MQRQIKSFTANHIRYFLPATPPAYHDDAKPWDAERSKFLIHAAAPRATHSEYTSTEDATVEYLEEQVPATA